MQGLFGKQYPGVPAGRAALYVAEMDPAVQGSHGHDKLFRAAFILRRGFSLDRQAALKILWKHFNPRCKPQWNRSDPEEARDFERKVDEVMKRPNSEPEGWLVADVPGTEGPVMEGVGDAGDVAAIVEDAEYTLYNPSREAAKTVPDHLLRCPGLVDDITEHTLRSAPYPNRGLAFLSSISLVALLASRQYTASTTIRPNLYAVALAPSGIGKEHPRKVVQALLAKAGLNDKLQHNVGSYQKSEDGLMSNPDMLLQMDEIVSLMSAVSRAGKGKGDARYLEIGRWPVDAL